MEHRGNNSYDKLQRITDDVYKYCNVEQGVGLLLSDEDALRVLAGFDNAEEGEESAEEMFTVEDVYESFGDSESILLRDKKTNLLIGAIALAPFEEGMQNQTVYERIWLRVDKSFQDKGYGIYLMDSITRSNSDKCIVSCTNNPKVSHINTHYLQMKELTEEQLSVDLKTLLESGGSLEGNNYQYFVNDALYAVLCEKKD